MKYFIAYNGLEYSKLFNNFSKENDIVKHQMVVGSPQQNGQVERFNIEPF